VVSGEIVLPSARAVALYEAMPEVRRDAQYQAEDRAYLHLLSQSDVLFWMDSGAQPLRHKPWEWLLAKSPSIRSVHFHWFLPDREDERAEVECAYARAIFVDPASLRARQQAIVDALRGSRAHMISPAGTELDVEVRSDAKFMFNDGTMDRAKAAYARSVRGREEEFPASALRTVSAVLSGVLVAKPMLSEGCDRIMVKFERNRVISVEGDGDDCDAFEREYASASGDKDRFAELLIGVNPELPKKTQSGWYYYYGTGAGMIQVRIGDNWESGGANRAERHWGEIFLLDDATLSVDGRHLIEDGMIVTEP
jgi:hypothetical protein